MEGKLKMDGAEFVSLPEGVISSVLSLTSPLDACRSSTMSSILRSAAESDVVWERFLPTDYKEILSRSVSPVPSFSSKKELFFHLCDSILVDGSFSLDKATGKKCYRFCANELYFIWGNDNPAWMWKSVPGSRFSEAAILKSITWLELTGSFDTCMLSPRTSYVANLIVRFKDNWSGLDVEPAEVHVIARSHVSTSMAFLRPDYIQAPRWGVGNVEVQIPRHRNDGWMELKLGDFINFDGHQGVIHIGLRQVNHEIVKKGLIIEGLEVRPRD